MTIRIQPVLQDSSMEMEDSGVVDDVDVKQKSKSKSQSLSQVQV